MKIDEDLVITVTILLFVILGSILIFYSIKSSNETAIKLKELELKYNQNIVIEDIEGKIKELEKQAEIEEGIGLRYSEKGKIYAQIRILKDIKEKNNWRNILKMKM